MYKFWGNWVVLCCVQVLLSFEVLAAPEEKPVQEGFESLSFCSDNNVQAVQVLLMQGDRVVWRSVDVGVDGVDFGLCRLSSKHASEIYWQGEHWSGFVEWPQTLAEGAEIKLHFMPWQLFSLEQTKALPAKQVCQLTVLATGLVQDNASCVLLPHKALSAHLIVRKRVDAEVLLMETKGNASGQEKEGGKKKSLWEFKKADDKALKRMKKF